MTTYLVQLKQKLQMFFLYIDEGNPSKFEQF